MVVPIPEDVLDTMKKLHYGFAHARDVHKTM